MDHGPNTGEHFDLLITHAVMLAISPRRAVWISHCDRYLRLIIYRKELTTEIVPRTMIAVKYVLSRSTLEAMAVPAEPVQDDGTALVT